MSKLKCKIGEFCSFNLQHIFVQVVRAQVWQKRRAFKERVSGDYCYLYVNIIRFYMCLESNHQLTVQRGAYDVCNKAVRRIRRVLMLRVIFRPHNLGL